MKRYFDIEKVFKDPKATEDLIINEGKEIIIVKNGEPIMVLEKLYSYIDEDKTFEGFELTEDGFFKID